jgi:hypothetical protein
MYRHIVCIQKQPSLTAEEFKSRYENHVSLALSLTSVRPITYKRRYIVEELDALNTGSTKPLPFDVVTEVVYESKEMCGQFGADLYGKNREQIWADEDRFMIRETMRVFVVDECVTSFDDTTAGSA